MSAPSLGQAHPSHQVLEPRIGTEQLQSRVGQRARRLRKPIAEIATRLYPWVRADLQGKQPKSIVVDPRRGFGQSIIAGTGIQTRIVTERYRAGESVAELAQDYRLDPEQIEDAIRCETSEAA